MKKKLISKNESSLLLPAQLGNHAREKQLYSTNHAISDEGVLKAWWQYVIDFAEKLAQKKVAYSGGQDTQAVHQEALQEVVGCRYEGL